MDINKFLKLLTFVFDYDDSIWQDILLLQSFINSEGCKFIK